MELGKWSANEIALLRGVATGELEEIAMQLHDVVSTLGLKWSTRDDCFLFTVSLTSMPSVITKRNILSDVARLFDPLGWLAPVTITAKIILQDLWIEGVDWDVPVQGELEQRWQRFRTSIGEVAGLRIPRWFGDSERDSWTLHGFADASKRAYAAAVYTVIPGNSSTLMMAKTRVAPAKQETLPRLELCAATLLVRLTKQLLEVLSQQPEEIHFWSDSRVVLDWLKGHPSRWQTFVANRVSEIVNTFPQAQWHHVRSSNNAVDCATRGLTPEQLLESRLWWNGAVKSFKFHLCRVIGDTALTFEELSTLAAKVEACLNSRPLCRISSQPEDLVALTPAHFLTGTDYLSIPEKYDVSDKQSYGDRWQLLSYMRDAFWNRWRKEVMHQLQLRNKWLHQQENLEKGDLVIIKDDLSPPARWPIGLIINSSPGADGRVRVVTVRTATSTFVRPVVKLIKLPVDARANEEYERRQRKR